MPKVESSYVLKDSDGQEEGQRLDTQHEFIKLFTSHGLLHPSIPLTGLKNIADVATGSGIWLQELSIQLQNDDISRRYIGFDMTLSQIPASHSRNITFIEHNVLVPFPDQFLGTFDLVHVRLLAGGLKKGEIPVAVEHVKNLIKPGGYLQWDDGEATSMRAIPPNDLANQFYSDFLQFGNMVGFDLKFPYTVKKICKDLGMKEMQMFVSDSLDTPEMVAKTRTAACAWYLDVVGAVVPVYMPLLYGMTKEEALIKRDELVESMRQVYEGGVTPGFTIVTLVARKALA